MGGGTLPPFCSNMTGAAGLHLLRPSARQPVPHGIYRKHKVNAALKGNTRSFIFSKIRKTHG
jgi:hypothetical protein